MTQASARQPRSQHGVGAEARRPPRPGRRRAARRRGAAPAGRAAPGPPTAPRPGRPSCRTPRGRARSCASTAPLNGSAPGPRAEVAGRHHVDVAVEHQRRPVAPARGHADQPPRLGAVDLDAGEVGRGQGLRRAGSASGRPPAPTSRKSSASIVWMAFSSSRSRDAGDADEPAQRGDDLGGVGVDVLAGPGVPTGLRRGSGRASVSLPCRRVVAGGRVTGRRRGGPAAAPRPGRCRWRSGQRGWKRQPDGGRPGSARRPAARSAPGRRPAGTAGTDEPAAPRCTGGPGTRRRPRPAPTSTIRPRYMTAMRSEICRTTERSWAMNT